MILASLGLTFGLVLVLFVEDSISILDEFCPEPYRLPKNIVPSGYELNFKFKEENLVEGEAKIFVRVENGITHGRYRCTFIASEPKTIILNVDESVELMEVNYFESRLQLRERKNIADIKYIKEKQLMIIYLEQELKLYPYKSLEPLRYLEIRFKSRIRRDMQGIYKSKDCNGGTLKIAQFKPIGARLAFPCFDEPNRKATFSLSIEHAPDETALSNMPVEKQYDTNGHRVTVFKKSPQMSVHMVAFAVGKLEHIETDIELSYLLEGQNKITIRAYKPLGSRANLKFAHVAVKSSFEWMAENIKFAYPLKKFDLVAVPELEKNNHGSWGLTFIRFNESHYEDGISRYDLKITIGLNVAHVVASQWFGNLITADWWDSFWTTETIAAELAFEMAQDLYRYLGIDYFIRLKYLSPTLQMDSVVGGRHPLRYQPGELTSLEQIRPIFDNFAFVKGASLAHMAQYQFNFKDRRLYLKSMLDEYKYSSFNKDDFMSKFRQFRSIQYKWKPSHSLMSLSSYPVINCDVDETGKFLLLGMVKVQTWDSHRIVYVRDASKKEDPMSLRVSDIEFGQATRLPKWFDIQNEQHWLKLNLDPVISTYFRVNYSRTIIETALKHAIEQKFMGPLDRLNVIDDAVGLVKAGEMDLDLLKLLFSYYQNEDHEGVIMGLVEAAEYLLEMDKDSSMAYETLNKFYHLFQFESKSFEIILRGQARMMTLDALIRFGNEEVITKALKKFDDLENGMKLHETIELAVIEHGSSEQRHRLTDILVDRMNKCE